MKERNEVMEEAYLKHYDTFYRIAYNRLKTQEDAEDAVQEAFTLGIKYYKSFDSSRNGVAAWLRTILNNVCNDITASIRNKGVSMEFDEELHEGVEMTHLGDQLLDKMKGHIEECKMASHRSALHLHFVQGATRKDICKVLDMKYGNLCWVIDTFRNRMEGLYGGG